MTHLPEDSRAWVFWKPIVLAQAQMFRDDPNSVTEKEKMEMAVVIFKLSADPAASGPSF